MPKTIKQTVTLPASHERLFRMYLDPKAHGAFTGDRVDISGNPAHRSRHLTA